MATVDRGSARVRRSTPSKCVSTGAAGRPAGFTSPAPAPPPVGGASSSTGTTASSTTACKDVPAPAPAPPSWIPSSGSAPNRCRLSARTGGGAARGKRRGGGSPVITVAESCSRPQHTVHTEQAGWGTRPGASAGAAPAAGAAASLVCPDGASVEVATTEFVEAADALPVPSVPCLPAKKRFRAASHTS